MGKNPFGPSAKILDLGNLKKCDHRGYVVPTVLIPMAVPGAKDAEGKETTIVVYLTQNATCVRCNQPFTFGHQAGKNPLKPQDSNGNGTHPQPAAESSQGAVQDEKQPTEDTPPQS